MHLEEEHLSDAELAEARNPGVVRVLTPVAAFNRTPRSEEQARRDRDELIVANLLLSARSLRLTARAEMLRAQSEAVRLKCDRVAQAVDELERELLLGAAR